MINYVEAARSGRVKALEALAVRRASGDQAPTAPEFIASSRSMKLPVELPVFVSQRHRVETPAFLH